jgi:hypothetical protein
MEQRMNNTVKTDGNITAEIIRNMIRHENELVNHRITWLSQLQGLLFAALGFSWDNQDAHLLVYCLCLLGSLIALSSLVTLASGDEAINNTLYWWDIHKPIDYFGPDVIGLTSNGIGNRNPLYLRFFSIRFKANKMIYPWYVLPRLFIGAWIAISFFNFIRG